MFAMSYSVAGILAAEPAYTKAEDGITIGGGSYIRPAVQAA